MARFRLFRAGIWVVLVGALLLGAPRGVCAAGDHRALYKQGLRAYRAGNIEQAIDRFRRSEDADPTYPYPAFALGRIYHQLFVQEMRYYRDAVEAYDRVAVLLRIDPPSAGERSLYQAFFFRGLLLLKGGDYAAAIRSLTEFQELLPDFYAPEQVHNAIGIAHYYQDQYDEAVSSFKAALDDKPDYPEARFNLRSVYTRLATYNEAVAAARAADVDTALAKAARLREFAPRYLPGRQLEADLLRQLGELGPAEAAYREIVALGPGNPISYTARLELAKLLAGRNRVGEALDLLMENRKRFPRVPDPEAKRELDALVRRLETIP